MLYFADGYDMTAEEEATLLESEDSNECCGSIKYNNLPSPVNDKPILNNENFSISVTGNTRSVISGNKSNDLKRTTTDIFQTENIKKRKWDTRFSNLYKTIRVYLKDIGYESHLEEKSKTNYRNDNNSTKYNRINDNHQNNTAAESKVNTFRIIVDRDSSTRVCQEVDNVPSTM